MLNGRELVVDTMSEVHDLLRDLVDHEFWNLADHTTRPGAIYILGRQQVVENRERVRVMCGTPDLTVVFGNSAEGSTTSIDQCDRVLGLRDLIQRGHLLLISGGDLPTDWPYLLHEHFITRILDYEDNLREIAGQQHMFEQTPKPYSFLLLNGRARPHRRYILQQLDRSGVLAQGLWTQLDGRRCDMRQFPGDSGNAEIRYLPPEYEVPRYHGYSRQDDYPHQCIKHEMFAGEWGEIYLWGRPYRDSYFSIVTETVYETAYSFRTEKIAKPLAIGHPWICAANAGFYRDLRDLGFRTFDGIIDESFDEIDDAKDRMDRIVAVVQDLCRQDLDAFLREAAPICKYNQQFLPEFIREHRKDFPGRFQQFIQSHARS